MRGIHLVLLAFACSILGCQTPAAFSSQSDLGQPTHDLEQWFGDWQGEMVNLRGGTSSKPIPVSMRIQPLADGSIEWRTVYNNDLERGLKDYRVIPNPNDPTRFTLDEQNGILLKLRLIDGVLISPFEVGGHYLVSQYTLKDDGSLVHEILVWNAESASTTAATSTAGDDFPQVQAFEISSIQRTIFRRKAVD